MTILDHPMSEDLVTNPKGTPAETAVVDYLRSRGWPHAERRAKTGQFDKGDINVDPGVVIEVKNCKTMDLAGWLKQTETEMDNAEATVGACFHKKRGKGSPANWYVTMSGHSFVTLLQHFCGTETTE